MENGITFVGLDAHKKAISAAMLLPGQMTPVRWEVVNEPGAVKRAVKRVVRRIERETPGEVRFCYEAGSLGYALQREITEAGSERVSCGAPIPVVMAAGPRQLHPLFAGIVLPRGVRHSVDRGAEKDAG